MGLRDNGSCTYVVLLPPSTFLSWEQMAAFAVEGGVLHISDSSFSSFYGDVSLRLNYPKSRSPFSLQMPGVSP